MKADRKMKALPPEQRKVIRNYSIVRIVCMLIVLSVSLCYLLFAEGMPFYVFGLCLAVAFLVPWLYKWMHLKIISRKNTPLKG